MSSIVKMYDASNNDVYPITHLRAVRDSNGTTLESMIQGVNETTVGYYECTTAGSTPEKTITIDSSVSLSVRISCKVKFAEKNTGANATMNINNTGAKPLFYNGVRAAANNSWYTNEIVDLYFDGTNYQSKSCADTLEYDVSLHQTHEITEVTTTTRTVVYNGDVTSGWENETSVSDSSVNGYTRTETNTGKDNDTTTVDGPTAKYDTASNKTSVVYVTKRTLTHVVNDYTFDEAVNAVPMSYRHGGLKLRFISNSNGSLQNSDNKYVQWRLMATSWSTTVSDWQGVDDEPVVGSENLVKSGGVAYSINQLKNAGYLYVGIATPTTNPGTPDGPVFYIANGKGTYTNFGGINVTEDEVVILYYDTVWHKEATGIASNDKITELERKVVKEDLKINSAFESEYVESYNLFRNVEGWYNASKYLSPHGTLSNGDNYVTSNFIKVTSGDNIKLKSLDKGSVFTRIAFYRSNDVSTYIEGSYQLDYNTIAEVVAPEGANYMMATGEIRYLDRMQITIGELMPYQQWFEPKYDMTLSPDVEDKILLGSKNIKDSSITKDKIDQNIADALLKEHICKNLFNINDDGNEFGYLMSSSIQQSPSYNLTHAIAVEPLTTYSLSRNGEALSGRFIAFLSTSDATSSLDYSQNVSTFQTPENCHYVRISIPVSSWSNIQLEQGAQPTSYQEWFEKYYSTNIHNDSVSMEKLSPMVRDLITTQNEHPKGFLFGRIEQMTSGDELVIGANCVKTYKEIVFSGMIGTFNSLVVGHGRLGGYSSAWIEIDHTNIYTHMNSDSVSDTIPHGLTITNNIQVRVIKDFHVSWGKVEIISNGQKFSTETHWTGDCGDIYAKSIGSTLSNCSLGWSSKCLTSPIWMFGDSYFSITPDRWVYYLKNQHDKVLIDGLSGAYSTTIYPDLENLLKIGKPDVVIWCLGMNDPDTQSEVNASWKSVFDKVVKLCSDNNITLIAATIPTVRGGVTDDSDVPPNMRIHKFKNEIVKASGLRYIDFESAVGASRINGEWFDGMLEDAGVHPTESGAKALFYQALSDAPELIGADSY